MPNNVCQIMYGCPLKSRGVRSKIVSKIFKKSIKNTTKKSITKCVNIKNPTVIADMMKLVKEGELRYNMAGFIL